jgi:hypothetical protein
MSQNNQRFVVCISNEGCDDLELRKLYPVVTDSVPGEEEYLRVIDESGEDYLYPAKCFAQVDLPAEAAEALAAV